MEVLLPLLLPSPPLLILLLVHPCFLCCCSCRSCLSCLFLCLHRMCHHRSAQPTSLNGHREQESQSRARSHVLTALDSTCREPPCTPSRLRTGSCQHYILPLRKSPECRSLANRGGSSQTLLSSRFPGQFPPPSRPDHRLKTVARWRKSRPNRCTGSHLPGSSLLPKPLAFSCPCCQPWTDDDTTSGVCAWSLQHVPSEIVNIGQRRSGVTVFCPQPRFVIKPECSFLNLTRIQICRWSDRLWIVHCDKHACLDQFQHQLSQHLHMPCFLSPRNLARSVQDGVRRPHIGDSQGVECPEHLSCYFLKEQQDQVVSFRFREIWHVQPSPGQRTGNSTKPTNQSWSNQLLLITLESCDQGFDLRSVVVQTLRGQTVETGIQLKIVIIF